MVLVPPVVVAGDLEGFSEDLNGRPWETEYQGVILGSLIKVSHEYCSASPLGGEASSEHAASAADCSYRVCTLCHWLAAASCGQPQ